MVVALSAAAMSQQYFLVHQSSKYTYSLWPRAKLAKKGISNPNRHVHNATAVAVISVVAKQQQSSDSKVVANLEELSRRVLQVLYDQAGQQASVSTAAFWIYQARAHKSRPAPARGCSRRAPSLRRQEVSPSFDWRIPTWRYGSPDGNTQCDDQRIYMCVRSCFWWQWCCSLVLSILVFSRPDLIFQAYIYWKEI